MWHRQDGQTLDANQLMLLAWPDHAAAQEGQVDTPKLLREIIASDIAAALNSDERMAPGRCIVRPANPVQNGKRLDELFAAPA
jgi:hypothetical protein